MTIHQWSPPFFDLLFDVLSGCSGGCKGCGVTRAGQMLPAVLQYREMIARLERLERESQFVLDHLEVGPTDFMTAANSREMLDEPLFRELSARFNITYFTTTLTAPDSGEWARRLHEALPGHKLYFYVVLDPARLSDRPFIRMLHERMDQFRQTLEKRPQFEIVLNSQPHTIRRGSNLLNALVETTQAIREEFQVKPWHVISSSRKESLAQHARFILNDIRWLNAVFNHWIQEEMEWDAHFQYGNEIKPTNKVLAWRNGNWYWPPVLYGHFVNYDEKFKLPGDLTIENLTEFENRMLVEQYAQADHQDDCSQCAHLAQCVQQGVIQLATTLKTRECIAPKQAFDRYRQKGLSP